jgi:hypothetical protein
VDVQSEGYERHKNAVLTRKPSVIGRTNTFMWIRKFDVNERKKWQNEDGGNKFLESGRKIQNDGVMN